MIRKIARQSETTPTKSLDDYLWNERLGVTQLPPVDTSQGQQNMSSLPPQSSQAPTIDYDSANGQNDTFGSGVSSEGQLIAPKAPMQERSSAPAVSKAASNWPTPLDLCPGPECNKLIEDFDTDGYECNNGQRWCGTHHPKSCTDHETEFDSAIHEANNNSSFKSSAISTLYGDVNPTPTTGEANNGSQSNRNNSPDPEPNNPEESPVKNIAPQEEGGAGLASELGEAATLAFASKRFIGSVLDPKESKKDDAEGHYKYIKHRNGKWVIIQKGTGKVLSTHDSREKAIASFKAMEMSKHGSTKTHMRDWWEHPDDGKLESPLEPGYSGCK